MAKVPAVYDVTFQGIPGYWSGFDISKVDDDQLYHPYLLQRMLAISAEYSRSDDWGSVLSPTWDSMLEAQQEAPDLG